MSTYTSLYIKIGVDCSTSAKVDGVSSDVWSRLLSLDVDSCSVAGYDLVVLDRYLVLRLRLHHYSAGFEVLKVAVLYVYICIDSYKACCARIVCRITFKLAVDHLNRGAIEYCDARDFTVRFTKYSTGERRKEVSKSH